MAVELEEQLTNIYTKLGRVSKFDEIIEISRTIFFMKISKDSVTPGFKSVAENIIKLLQNHLAATKLIRIHKILIKSIVKLSTICDVNCFGDEYLEKYTFDHGISGSNSLSAYGRLQNYKLFEGYIYNPEVLYDTMNKCSLKYSKNTQFFELAIENYIQAYDIQLIKENNTFVMTLLCANLENNHKNIHKLLLELFKRILKVADKNDEDIMNLVLNNFSWYNRNKHYLLSEIIQTKPEMLLSHKDFNIDKFFNGLRIALSHYHLYSSSMSVVKATHDKNPFRQELLNISRDIIINGSEYEMRNFLRLWFTAYDDKLKDELFNAVLKSHDFSKVSSTSGYFYRSLIIRNAFNRPLSPQIENSVKSFCDSIEDVNMKMEIFNVLLSTIYESKDFKVILENIMRFLKFIHNNMSIEDSMFIDHVMRKLPNFFNHLATSRFRNKEVCREIFTIIREDIFYHGLKFGTYETKVFSLKLLDVMLKQYCGITKGRRLSKKTDSKINQEFTKYLKSHDIWDITSIDIFNHLVDMSTDTENSDISGTANEIIQDYFIKTINDDTIVDGMIFKKWIGTKMNENINTVDVEEYHENISYSKMKIEHLLAKNTNEFMMELKRLISELDARHVELKLTSDPVAALEKGKSLFVLIDVINYCLSRTFETKHILKVTKLSKDIAIQFLDFINDTKSSPSFDMLDKNLKHLVVTSKCKSSISKHKLLLSFFFTTRALSELTVTLAKIINNTMKPHDDDYFIGMSTCIAVNIQILTRFCHKGVIESASQSLGAITKIVSSEFLQQCDRTSCGATNLKKLLILLKHEIDCGRRHSSKTGEIRGSRGLVLMAHLIIKNHPPFLKFLMEQLLDLTEISTFNDTQKIKFRYHIQPIHLHLLAIIVKDSELVEEMLPYYDYILICTFRAYKESDDFVMQNALLQIIGNITPKISNHKRHTIDEISSPQYESKAISVYEHYVKFTYSYRIALFDFENNMDKLSQTYIIILLEILSNFEHREPYEPSIEIEKMIGVFKRLIEHPCEKIRILAARCYAQWHLPEKMLNIINDKIRYIFYKNPNLAYGSITAVRYLILRYEASIKFVTDFDRDEMYRKWRMKILSALKEDYSEIPKSFYLRHHLFEFLVFLGFDYKDDLIQSLMNEENITSKIGYQLWRKKIAEHESFK